MNKNEIYKTLSPTFRPMVKGAKLNSTTDHVKQIKDFMRLEITSAKDKYGQNLPSESVGTSVSTHLLRHVA